MFERTSPSAAAAMTIASSHRVPPANSPRSEPPVERAGSTSHDQGSRQVAPSASTARRATAVRSSCPSPSRAKSTGVPSDSAYVVISAATAGSGGLDTSTMSSVDGSAASSAKRGPGRATADARREVPAADPEAVADADPGCCRAGTSAAGPRCRWRPRCRPARAGPRWRTRARHRPPTAVPQSGPITSRPRRAASSLSRTSASTGTLSLKTSTDRPALQGVHRLGEGVRAGHRDQGEVGAAGAAGGRRHGPRGRLATPEADAPGRAGRARGQRCLQGRERRGHRLGVGGPQRHDEVVGAGARGWCEAGAAHQVEVELGAHRDLRGRDAVDAATSRLTCIRVTESW